MTAPETLRSGRTLGLAAVLVALFGSAFYFRDRFQTSEAPKLALSTPVETPSKSEPTKSAPSDGGPSSPATSERTASTDAPVPPAAPNPSDVSTSPDATVLAKTQVAAAPQFDVVRVEPSGEALMAGRGKPDGTVALVAGGKVIAEAKADSGGNFVMTPPALKPGDYAFSLRQGEGSAARESTQSVTVVVPKKGQQVVVALAEPGKATKLLSDPPVAAPAPVAAAVPPSKPVAEAKADIPAAAPKLAIRSVELENGSGLFASGAASPGTDVRLYLNDSHVADVIAAAAGTWSVKVRKGLAAGHYAVRADSVTANHAVTARVEVPFDVPAAMAPATAASAVPPLPVPRPQDLEPVARAEAPSKAEALASVAPAAAPAQSATPVAPPQAPAAALPQQAAAAEAPAATKPDVAAMAPAEQVASQVTSQDTKPAPSPIAATANAVIDDVQTEIVSHGDNLWRISRKRFGHGTRYTQIYAANLSQIRDPKLIYPGQVFVMPQN